MFYDNACLWKSFPSTTCTILNRPFFAIHWLSPCLISTRYLDNTYTYLMTKWDYRFLAHTLIHNQLSAPGNHLVWEHIFSSNMYNFAVSIYLSYLCRFWHSIVSLVSKSFLRHLVLPVILIDLLTQHFVEFVFFYWLKILHP